MQIESIFTMCFVLSVKPINVSMIVRLFDTDECVRHVGHGWSAQYSRLNLETNRAETWSSGKPLSSVDAALPNYYLPLHT